MNTNDRQALIEDKKRRIEELRRKREEEMAKPQRIQQEAQPTNQDESTPPQAPAQVQAPQHQGDLIALFLQQKRKKLGYCQVDIYANIPAPIQVEAVTVEFGIQCDIEEPEEEDDVALPQVSQQRRDSKIKKDPQSAEKQQIIPVVVDKKITGEEVHSILASQAFGHFFSRTTKIVEKAIVSDVDILEDLMASQNIVHETAKDALTSVVTLYDPTYSANRVVTSLQWSPTLPNTLLAGYSQNEDASITDQVGVALIWSMQLKSRPEFYCFASSPITSCVFHPFHPSIVLGGLYNGQIVVWDLRAKQTPEKRTTLNSGGHSYPIYGLSVVGSQNAHNLVSVSNDGRVCMWNLAMLNQPQKIIDLKTKSKGPQPASVEVNVTSLKFPNGDANNFYVGGEDGCVYRSKLHPNQNDPPITVYEEHNAPVSGISLNQPVSGSPLLHNLVLSSSFDWTVKLWNPRNQNQQCLLTMECSEDYVYDVAWNGVHPAMFSSVDGEGYVDLWDLSTDMEAPITRHKAGNNSINKQEWANDGMRLAIGDAYGSLQVLQVAPKVLRVDQDKINKLEQFIKLDK